MCEEQILWSPPLKIQRIYDVFIPRHHTDSLYNYTIPVQRIRSIFLPVYWLTSLPPLITIHIPCVCSIGHGVIAVYVERGLSTGRVLLQGRVCPMSVSRRFPCNQPLLAVKAHKNMSKTYVGQHFASTLY